MTRGIDSVGTPGYYNFYATLTNDATGPDPAARRVAVGASRGFPRWSSRGAIATIAAVVTMRKYRSQPPQMFLTSRRLSNAPGRRGEPAGTPAAPFGLPPAARTITLS